MHQKNSLAWALVLAIPCAPAWAQMTAVGNADALAVQPPVKSLGVVTVSGGQPTSMPTQIPTTFEGVTREQIESTVNAFDSEDALKYFPSLLVRKRYIGDYNHAMLSSRASGTGNSPRSLVYADGILLSNLLGSGVGTLSFAPRWNMVTPEEIERVDVMYGPFSAAYPGNSMGAVVDYTTRMPRAFEAAVKLAHNVQPFQLYGTKETYGATQGAFNLGSRSGNWSWFVAAERTDSLGQPLTFKTVTPSATAASGQTPVAGAWDDRGINGQPIYVIGAGTQYHTVQDHAKLKLAYDISPALRASYVLGVWQNTAQSRSSSYLRDATGTPVYSGTYAINGYAYSALRGTDFALSNESLQHLMHGLSLKSQTRGVWDWEVSASLYDYARDEKRNNGAANTTSNPLPGAESGGPGTIADGRGSGWQALAARWTWRPVQAQGRHVVDFGLQYYSGQLSYRVYNTSDWVAGSAGVLNNAYAGKTSSWSAYAQDSWSLAPRWKTVLGARLEQWAVYDGRTDFASATTNAASSTFVRYERREETHVSPKVALSHQWTADTVLKLALGRAVRMPTLGELYGSTSSSNSTYVNDPYLRPEKSINAELSMEKDLGRGLLRLTLFAAETRDAIYSQTTYPDPANPSITVNRVTNVDRVLTKGVELAFGDTGALVRGLDLQASLTYADAKIIDNSGYVSTPGDTIGKWEPNIPDWRATLLASYRIDAQWQLSLGARYSGTQYRTLNNADTNGYTYMGVSPYFTTDLRLRYLIDRNWTASFGIDNLNNQQYWNFHPYPQRNYTFELKWTH
jgi:iron complex outermembrane receptor protein